MYNNNVKEEIQRTIRIFELSGERIVDILLEIQRKYQLDVDSLVKLLTKEQKEKMKQQELKYKTIRK